MTDLVLINNQEVSFEVVGEQTCTTSLDIASVFGKRHDNIIAQIRNFPKDEFGVLNFKETYKDTELKWRNKLFPQDFALKSFFQAQRVLFSYKMTSTLQ